MSKVVRDRAARLDPEDVLAGKSATTGRAAFEADQVSSDADLASATADMEASGRDDAAADREVVSAARDTAARARDRAAEELEFAQGPGGPEYEAAIEQAGAVRAQAAADRERAAADRKEAAVDRAAAVLDRDRAAQDREHAAMDREHAAMDRRQALAELERANTDDLTGAYRRGTGAMVLQQELDRAGRSGEGLVLAFVDVDGLKATNDEEGHAAGDARLRDVVSALRSKVRSYEPIVRHGGDEFLCSLAGVDMADVRARFDEVEMVLWDREHPGAISVGLAELQAQDTLQDLINRADDAMIETRGKSWGLSKRPM